MPLVSKAGFAGKIHEREPLVVEEAEDSPTRPRRLPWAVSGLLISKNGDDGKEGVGKWSR